MPSDEDVSKLLSVVDSPEDEIAFLLLVDTGIRIQELATIKIKNINLNDASIVVNGKGGKTRTVYLSEITIEHLKSYVQDINGEYLFPPSRVDARSQYRNRTFFERRLRELCKQAGIERITPHQLRHFFATYTLSRGGDIKAVSELLGHADVGITLKIYHHVNAKAIRQMHWKYSPICTIGNTLISKKNHGSVECGYYNWCTKTLHVPDAISVFHSEHLLIIRLRYCFFNTSFLNQFHNSRPLRLEIFKSNLVRTAKEYFLTKKYETTTTIAALPIIPIMSHQLVSGVGVVVGDGNGVGVCGTAGASGAAGTFSLTVNAPSNPSTSTV